MNSKDVGIETELEVLTKLVKLGFIVSQPYGDNAPYDFIVDNGEKLLKIQVKTAEERQNNSLRISLSKREGSKRIKRKKYKNLKIDGVIAYSKTKKEFYYINLHKYKISEIHLRDKNTVKKKLKTMHFTEDFILENILNKNT